MSELNWETAWRATFGFSPAIPSWVIAALVLALVYLVIIVPAAAVVSYLDRKLGADFQARVGPNRAGPAGMLQPLADLLKLVQKEPSESWSWREALWFGVYTMALYSTVAVLPLGSTLLLVDTDMSAFLPFWAALVLALGTMLLGLSQKSIPGWLGGIRVASQSLAGALPAMVSLLCAGIATGGFRWSAFVAAQGAWPFQWIAFSNPFEFVAFVVFVASGLVVLGVAPLDAGLSLPDIHGGVTSHLSGRRLSLFRLGRFYGFFLWSIISSVLFLGAWNLPSGLGEALGGGGHPQLLEAAQLALLLIKTGALMLLVVWMARVNPKSRIDQITDFSWKVLSPAAFLALIGVGVFAAWTAWRASS
jgi:NADH-quinone oxidoreductase subunit H